MAEAAVGFLLENVKNVVKNQLDLISGAETELEQLQKMLEMMAPTLKDLAEMAPKGHVLVQLERHIREAVYNAEDIIDASLTHTSNAGLAKKVKELREKELQPLYERATQALTALPMRDVSAATRPGRSDDDKLEKLSRERNVVGLADQEATLIKYLKEETDELDVISIVGTPGLGKTTLASKIYRDPKTKLEFPTLIWVYVSQEFNAKDVFLTILKNFPTNQDMSTKNDHELAREVRSHLEKEKFLLFMDDVRTVEDWQKIEAALPKNNKSGKVLITSRHASVAAQANRNRAPHWLRFLNFDESWELLQLEVFRKNNDCPPELERIGKQIAKSCGGVPLAVVVIGGILVEKGGEHVRRDLWEKVAQSVNEYIMYDEHKRTESIILLSYNKLPHDLRDCFLYLGMFPEDTEIPSWKLIRLWIAEGFIKANQNRGIMSLEEVAQDNLNDLVARNLVMAEKFKANGDVKTCRVHDMIREFCKSKASVANMNLYQEVKMTRQGVFDPSVSEIGKFRRLCIHSNVTEFFQRKPKGPKVRSFVCFSMETVNLPTENIASIPEAFELLRVIDVSPIKFTNFPPTLTRLIHLRYITLSGNDLRALPEDASKLWNLQTVKIDTTAREFEIKADIGKMKQLRHLKTKAAIVLKEVEAHEGGEINLQTLSRLSTKSCTETVFSRAKNLKNLGIRGNLDTLRDAYLEKLERLEKLKLVHDTFPRNAAANALHCLPLSHIFPPNLRILTLSSTYLGWREMARLGSLLIWRYGLLQVINFQNSKISCLRTVRSFKKSHLYWGKPFSLWKLNVSRQH